MNDLPPFVRAERDALLAEIEAAFDGVSREGGTSWAMGALADVWGDPARVDPVGSEDVRWQDLLEGAEGFPGNGIGYWPFLDAIGFRYYLPAAMTLSVLSGEDATIAYPLTLSQDGLKGHVEDRWTLLNLRQRRTVKRFLQYMAVVDALSSSGRSDWQRALKRYWQGIPDEPN